MPPSTPKEIFKPNLISVPNPDPCCVVLPQASVPPYDLPKKYAEKAQEVFQNMLDDGLQADHYNMNALMTCQSKAALVDEAFATYAKMRQLGLQINSHTLTILASACGRARQPTRALDVLPEVQALPMLPAERTIVWNSILVLTPIPSPFHLP